MIINSQRTIYGLQYQTASLLNETHAPMSNTTLNEKFSSLADEALGADVTHNIKYLTIGIGGIAIANGTNSYSYSQHSPLDAALFEHTPFIVRPINNDLVGSERVRYRMRVIIDISGTQYYAYYLRKLNSSDLTTGTYEINSSATGVGGLKLLDTNTPTHLNPTPRTFSTAQVANTKYVTNMTKIKFELTPSDILELNNAISLIHGTGANKPITEIGICGGVDKLISGTLEALETQIYFHVGVDINTRLSVNIDSGYTRVIEIGGAEPIHA